MSVISAFALCDFCSKLSKQMPFLIHFPAALLMCWGTDFVWSNNSSDSICNCTVNFPFVSLGIQIELSVKYGMLK